MIINYLLYAEAFQNAFTSLFFINIIQPCY